MRGRLTRRGESTRAHKQGKAAPQQIGRQQKPLAAALQLRSRLSGGALSLRSRKPACKKKNRMRSSAKKAIPFSQLRAGAARSRASRAGSPLRAAGFFWPKAWPRGHRPEKARPSEAREETSGVSRRPGALFARLRPEGRSTQAAPKAARPGSRSKSKARPEPGRRSTPRASKRRCHAACPPPADPWTPEAPRCPQSPWTPRPPRAIPVHS